MRARRSVAERFWEKVDKSAGPDGCWDWTAHIDRDTGYGRMMRYRQDGKKRPAWAHRLAYEIQIGDIPAGKLVCHTCDNRRCMNPSHLFLGSYTDNSNDMDAKRRRPIGQDRTQAKLNDDAVRFIRSSGMAPAEMAKMFGVCAPLVYEVRSGTRWRHIK